MIKKFDEFINEEWNPFEKKEKTEDQLIDKPGHIGFFLPSGKIGYLKDTEIETECGGKGKLSVVFNGIGMDEEGHFIANCNHCKSNGILMEEHIIHNKKD